MGTNIFEKFHPDYDFGGRRVLNVGCGFGKFAAKNVTNLDAYAICKPDVVWDLSQSPLPFKDNTFDLILANHILEHVPGWWGAFSDFGRILKEGGQVEVFVPGGGSDSILGYRDHINTINYCSFFGAYGTYRNGSNAWAEEFRKGHANRLRLVSRKTRPFNKWWVEWAPTPVKRWMCEHLRNVVVEDGFIFQKVTEAEYQEEELRARFMPDGDKSLSLLRLQPSGVR